MSPTVEERLAEVDRLLREIEASGGGRRWLDPRASTKAGR